ncbi:MAG: hypothetical protein IH840_07930 [Candidatus Heimdallarchaeota archaeon]|nr:hypothetical protein [Candidatus Heimdallarchaeota archaeon]
MAILPILDKPEAKLILKELIYKSRSTKKLNEIIVNDMRKCSTATLYRRLKELHIANVVYLVNGKYSLTELGEELIFEIQSQEQLLEKTKLGLGHKQKGYLSSIGSKPYTQQEYQRTFQKSPTEISDQFKHLLKLGLIEIQLPKNSKKKRGRPTKRFKLTQAGKEVLTNLSKVDEILKGGKEDEN